MHERPDEAVPSDGGRRGAPRPRSGRWKVWATAKRLLRRSGAVAGPGVPQPTAQRLFRASHGDVPSARAASADCGSPVRPPTVISEGRLVAGRHPCAWGQEEAPEEVRDLLAQGVTLFLDLTQEGELEPYDHLVPADVRYVRRPIRDFSVPAKEDLATTLDVLDSEIESGGLVYVHCWAGCGRTGVVVGSWLVRHGLDPREALARIAETRGAGCPQTLQQRLLVLGWQVGS